MLLPDPSKYKPQVDKLDGNYDNQTVFFSHKELDEMAKYFIGNMHR